MTRQTKPRAWRHLLVVVAAWLVPVVGIGVGLQLPDALERRHFETATASTVVVGSRVDDHRTAVSVTLTLAQPRSVSSAVAGTVTSVPVRTGDAVAQGGTLVSIDYLPVSVFRMPSPLVRDLTVGDTGPDVRVLGEYLAQLGYLAPARVGAGFTPLLRKAVQVFQKARGLFPDGIMHLSSVAFVPADVARVGAVTARVGQRVDVGAALVDAAGSAAGARIESSAPDGSLATFGEGPVKLTTAAGAQIDLSSKSPKPEEFEPLSEWLAAHATSTAAAEPDAKTATFTGAIMTVAQPAKQGTVPASAVLVSRSGASCLLARTGGRVVVMPLASAAPLGSELGVVGVDAELTGTRVLTDASRATAAQRSTCG